MIIRFERFVAFRCPECGSISIKNINIFDFSGNKKLTLGCSCNSSYVEIIRNDNNYLVSAPCMSCFERHYYSIRRRDLWYKEIISLYCPVVSLGTVCIGEYDSVIAQLQAFDKQTINFLEAYQINAVKENEEEFVNEEVMFQVIEHIYRLIFAGKVFCVCGKNKFGFRILSDRVHILCEACGRLGEVMADSQDALLHLYNSDKIEIT